MLLYQAWLAAAFLVGRLVPLAGDALLGALALLRLGPDPAPPRGVRFAPPRGPRWFMAYPYVRSWMDRMLRGGVPGEPLTTAYPILFGHGTRKRVRFHSTALVRALAHDPRHRVLAYDCGHWVQHAEARALTEEIKRFMERSLGSLPLGTRSRERPLRRHRGGSAAP